MDRKTESGKADCDKYEKFPPFSVAMSVYGKDHAEWFDAAFASVINQTIKPNEIVLVVDGPVPDSLHKVIDKYREICQIGISLKVIQLAKNNGLGNSLRIAVQECRFELIARMDSDDIAVANRFEQQLRIFAENKEIDIVGGDIQEFIGETKRNAGKRIVPRSDVEIKKYLRKRCPFNHMTVMYKKSSVLAAGSYRDLFWNEDYWLWIRMAEKKCVMANTGTILVNVRVGKDMYRRRGGRQYFMSEKFLQSYMLKHGMILHMEYWENLVKRYIVQILLPDSIRGWVFRKFARK